jgi:hypothetical protein
MSPLSIQAPSDAQLDYIEKLAQDHGWQPPDAVASKQEASEIIDGMLKGTYVAARYQFPFDDEVPF